MVQAISTMAIIVHHHLTTPQEHSTPATLLLTSPLAPLLPPLLTWIPSMTATSTGFMALAISMVHAVCWRKGHLLALLARDEVAGTRRPVPRGSNTCTTEGQKGRGDRQKRPSSAAGCLGLGTPVQAASCREGVTGAQGLTSMASRRTGPAVQAGRSFLESQAELGGSCRCWVGPIWYTTRRFRARAYGYLPPRQRRRGREGGRE